MIGNRASARTRVAAALALAVATIGCDDRVVSRRIVSRPLTPALLPPAEPIDSDSALAADSGFADDSNFAAVLTLDGRSEWRYFLTENELSNGPLAPNDPFVSSLDDRRRAAGLPVLHLPPFVGAAFLLPILPKRPWRVEVEAGYGDGSALAATVVLLSRPHSPLPDHVAPGDIRSRLRGELVERTVLPLPVSGTIARATLAPNADAASALLLLSNHAERFERVTRVRILEATRYGELLAADAIDDSGFATLEIGGAEHHALVIPPGRSRVTAELPIPRDAMLSGRARAIEDEETKSAEFTLEIEVRGAKPSAEPLRLPITTIGYGGAFRVDLAGFAGRRATMRFHSNRNALALAEVTLAARSEPLAPVLVFALDGVTRERWREARTKGARTPILDSWILDAAILDAGILEDGRASVGAPKTLQEIVRERVEPGRRCVIVSPFDDLDARAFDARILAADGLDSPPLDAKRDGDGFEESAATLLGDDLVPGVVVLRTRVLEAALESGDPARVTAAFTALDRRAGDLLRRAIDLGVVADLEFVVLLHADDAWLRLPTRAPPR